MLITDTLNLSQCIKIALKNAEDIKIAKNYVREAKLNLWNKRFYFAPQIELSGGYNIAENTSHNLSLNLSVNPFNSGKNIIEIVAQKNLLNMQYQNYLKTKQNLILNVIEKYFNLLKAQEILNLYRENLERKRFEYEMIKSFIEAGLRPAIDSLKALSEYLSAKIKVKEAQNNVKIAEMELKLKMDLPFSEKITIKKIKFEKEKLTPIDTCIMLAMKQNPEIRYTRANIKVKSANFYQKIIDLLPNLTITGNYDYDVENKENDWKIFLGLTFTIFDAGKLWRQKDIYNLYLKNAKLEYEKTKKEIILEIQKIYTNLITASENVEIMEKKVLSAKTNYDRTLEMYKEGLSSFLDLKDAGIFLLESQIDYTEAIFDYLTKKYKLYALIGRLHE